MKKEFFLLLLLLTMGCMSNAKPANYICACKFICTNGYENIDYFQNVGLDNPNEINKCFEYANNSCSMQKLKLVKAECTNIYSREEFERVKGRRGG